MKYFYTDPLAAAWMAKNFGMRFFIYKDERLEILYHQFLNVALLNDSGKYFIHPDSMELITPQIGDKNGEGLTYLFCSYHEKNSWVQAIGNNYCEEHSKTALRNGIAFMWPESEAA